MPAGAASFFIVPLIPDIADSYVPDHVYPPYFNYLFRRTGPKENGLHADYEVKHGARCIVILFQAVNGCSLSD